MNRYIKTGLAILALFFVVAIYISETTRLSTPKKPIDTTNYSASNPIEEESIPTELPKSRTAQYDELFYSLHRNGEKILGRWEDEKERDYILYIYQSNDNRYFLTSIDFHNPHGKSLGRELVARHVSGSQRFQIKEFLGDINPKNGLPWSDLEYTDYYQIDAAGDLILADKIGIIRTYRKL